MAVKTLKLELEAMAQERCKGNNLMIRKGRVNG